MGFDISALSAYTEDQDFPLSIKAQAQGGLARIASKQTGIKSRSNLQFMETDVVFGAGSCTRTASGDTTFTQRTITVGDIDVSMDFCVKSLNGYWTQTLLKQGIEGEQEMPAEQLWLEDFEARFKKQLAISDYKGDTGSGDANLQQYDGFIKIVDNAVGVVEGNTGGVTVATGVTKTNILDIMDAMYREIPEAIADDENEIYWVLPHEWYKLYISALKDENLYHYKADSGEVKYYGTDITLMHEIGLAGTNRMYLTKGSNVVIGMDGDTDEENYKIRLDPVSEKSMFFDLSFKRGVQVKYPDHIVKFTLVP